MITPKEKEYWNRKGLSDQEMKKTMNEVLQSSYDENQDSLNEDPRGQASNTMFAGMPNEDMIKWQLELNSTLERVEHILRGDMLKVVKGSMIWLPPEKDEDRRLNEFGVSSVMLIVSMYINKNTILSNYGIDEIQEKMFDFGKELSDHFYLKYERMGMDTLEKRKDYPMMVREIVDAVHSTYNRALHGGERESIHKMISVNQSNQIQNPMQQLPQMRERSMLNPMRYLKGKNAM